MFSARELAALPKEMRLALELLKSGAPPMEIRRATGYYIYRQESLPDFVRRYIDARGLETLEADRALERQRAALVAVLGVTIVNCLVRNRVALSESALRTMPDANLLKMRNFGARSLRRLRAHFPYQAPEPAH